jgi:apolipoprotein N-acyltransferase
LIAASFVCGFVFALAFPRAAAAPAAWIAPALWLAFLPRAGSGRGLRSGFAFGLGFFGLLLNWVHTVLTHYTSLPLFLTVPIWLLLVGYLALYPALFGALVAGLGSSVGRGALILAPVLWVGLEFVRGRLFSGFPWGIAGYAHAGGLPLLQAASVGGVALVSLILVSGWAALAVLVEAAMPRLIRATADRRRDMWWEDRVRTRPGAVSIAAASVVLALVALAASLGALRLSAHPPAGSGEILDAASEAPGREEPGGFRVALVQGGYGGDLDYEEGKKALRTYLSLSRRAASLRPDLIVWPESNAPFQPLESPGYLDVLRGLSGETGALLLLGAVGGTEATGLTNSAWLVGSGGVVSTYDKRKLVPFGEFVPLQRVLPFIRHFVPGTGEFRPGRGVGVMETAGRRIGVSICYEMIFPEEILRQARAGAEMLVNVTNDSWYSRGGPWQHSDFAVLRSIETGLYSVRVASTGRTLVIDPFGRELVAGPLGGATVVWAKLPVPETRTGTVFVERGEWAAKGCAILTALAVAFLGVGNIIDRRRPRGHSGPR